MVLATLIFPEVRALLLVLLKEYNTDIMRIGLYG